MVLKSRTEGNRFDATVPLLDPYARSLTRAGPLRCRIVNPHFDWEGDAPLGLPWRDTVLYELHVKGYTALHPGVPERLRGKYLGLAELPVIEHLHTLGVTAVELLPCQSFLSEQFLLDRGLVNYWGYNSVAWFAPSMDYAVDDAVIEFKTMVKALHAARLEVILDVVFNHTAEGNEGGPTLSWRGIDNPLYYRLIRQDPRYYENLTGCGNTVNCEACGRAGIDRRLPEILGRGDARRRLPFRSRHRARARLARASTKTRRFSRRCAPNRRSRTSS